MLLQDLKGINLVPQQDSVGVLTLCTDRELASGFIVHGSVQDFNGGCISKHPRYNQLKHLAVEEVLNQEGCMDIVVTEPMVYPATVTDLVCYVIDMRAEDLKFPTTIEDFLKAVDKYAKIGGIT